APGVSRDDFLPRRAVACAAPPDQLSPFADRHCRSNSHLAPLLNVPPRLGPRAPRVGGQPIVKRPLRPPEWESSRSAERRLLAALVLAWFGWNLNWAEVSADIGRADWRMIAAAVVLVWLTYLIRAFRWRTLLAPLAPRASLREAFAATTVGFGAIFLAGRAV